VAWIILAICFWLPESAGNVLTSCPTTRFSRRTLCRLANYHWDIHSCNAVGMPICWLKLSSISSVLSEGRIRLMLRNKPPYSCLILVQLSRKIFDSTKKSSQKRTSTNNLRMKPSETAQALPWLRLRVLKQSPQHGETTACLLMPRAGRIRKRRIPSVLKRAI
jgi:hypothetical protein